MRYITRDNVPLSGATAAEVIDDLRRVSRDPRATLREFMLATARAASLQVGTTIGGDTASELLAGLLDARLLVEITDNG